MFSQTTEYALRAAVDLAYHHGQPRKTKEIANETAVPPGYLSKVLQDLGWSGLVDAKRGFHGGYVLTKDPNKITVFDIFDAVQPIRRITSCPLEIPDHGTNLCPLHSLLDRSIATIETVFRKVTLADLVAEKDRKPLCHAGEKAPRKRRSKSSN